MELYDAFFDGKRTKVQRSELEKHVEGSKNMDPDYKRALRCIFENFEKHEHHESRKRERETVDYTDHERDDDSDGEIDPQYGVFLSALKPHEKSYVIDGERNGVPIFVKCKAENSSEDELVHKNQRTSMNCVAEEIDGRSKGKSKVVYQRETHPVNEPHVPEKIVLQRHMNFKGRNTVRKENEANTKGIHQDQIDEEPEIIEVCRYRNFNGKIAIKKGNGVQRPHTKAVVEKPARRKLTKMVLRNELSSQKTASGNYYRNQVAHNAKARTGRKAIHAEIRNIESFNRTTAYQKKKIKCSNGKKEGNGEIDSEVEILDTEKGFLHGCVPSKTFHYSDDDSEHLGGPIRDDAFRKKVLCVLGKPFDEEEYKRQREAVRHGSYFDSYPALEKKLKKYRYKRRKCLAILRGFFFWLQNVSHEGVFKPWKDGECLKVEAAALKN